MRKCILFILLAFVAVATLTDEEGREVCARQTGRLTGFISQTEVWKSSEKRVRRTIRSSEKKAKKAVRRNLPRFLR